MNKPYVCRNFSLIDWSHKRLKNAIDLLLLYGKHFYGFSKSRRKTKHSFHNKQIQDLTWSQTTWSFMKFYFVHIAKVCFVFKDQFSCLYYMNKTLMRKSNSKLNFTKNYRASWFSHAQLKISQCSISLAQLGECSKSKVAALTTYPSSFYLVYFFEH